MDTDDRTLLTIGQMARRFGLPVRTIRYWSDIGMVPPAERSDGGYRLYDAEAVARLELVRTLRQLGLDDVWRVLENESTVAEVAAAHVEALDVQIRTLRLRRAVLSAVATGRSSIEEMALMNKLAKLSAEERKQIIDDFVAYVFRDLDPTPSLQAHMRQTPILPDDPHPSRSTHGSNWPSWCRIPTSATASGRWPSTAQRQGDLLDFGTQETTTAEFVDRVVAHAGAAAKQGVTPDSPQAAYVVDSILSDIPTGEPRAELLERLEVSIDPRAERYWQLLGVINGWRPDTPVVAPAFQWLISALRAHS